MGLVLFIGSSVLPNAVMPQTIQNRSYRQHSSSLASYIINRPLQVSKEQYQLVLLKKANGSKIIVGGWYYYSIHTTVLLSDSVANVTWSPDSPPGGKRRPGRLAPQSSPLIVLGLIGMWQSMSNSAPPCGPDSRCVCETKFL